MKSLIVTALAVLAICPAVLAKPDAALPTYTPRQVSLPQNTSYVLPGSTVRLYGASSHKTLIEALNAAYAKAHPGIQFDTSRMKGPDVGIPGLTFDVTAFAVLDRPYAEWEATSYEKITGQAPLELRIAGDEAKPGTESPKPVYIYLRVTEQQGVNDFLKEYFRLVYSQTGQEIVEACGYPPLTATQAKTELAKLNQPTK